MAAKLLVGLPRRHVVSADALVDTTDLRLEFPVKGAGPSGVLRAVDNITLKIRRGEVLGLVGESGCGKSSTGRALTRLVRPTSGRICFDGIDIAKLTQRQMRPLRHRIQMIFQHPAQALNPRLTIRRSVAEPLESIGILSNTRNIRVQEALNRVGLATAFGNRYPHELSGGQLQRVAIARALIAGAEFVVADEPLSALDLSVQAQVLSLLKELQKQAGVSLLFITHDLAVAEYISDRITVMYLGKIVESAPARRFSKQAKHPYSLALLNSVPRLDPVAERARARNLVSGEIPSPLRPPPGCRFHTRCPLATDQCRHQEPILRKISDDHEVSCWAI
jgi:oligopeptide transport system ATP-binding protein